MAFLRIFRTPKNQQFVYKPRFWDARKDELNERLRQAEERRDGGVDGAKSRIANQFRRGNFGFADQRYRQRQVFRSNLLLAIIVVSLVLFTLWALQVYLPELLRAIE